MEERRRIYTETFDPVAGKRFDKAVMKTMWKDWASYALVQTYHFAFACLIAVGMYAWLTGHGFDGAKIVLGIVAGTLLGTFTTTAKALEQSQDRRAGAAGTSLQCEISDNGYGYTH